MGRGACAFVDSGISCAFWCVLFGKSDIIATDMSSIEKLAKRGAFKIFIVANVA